MKSRASADTCSNASSSKYLQTYNRRRCLTTDFTLDRSLELFVEFMIFKYMFHRLFIISACSVAYRIDIIAAYQLPISTLLRVWPSSSPRKGERPLNLEQQKSDIICIASTIIHTIIRYNNTSNMKLTGLHKFIFLFWRRPRILYNTGIALIRLSSWLSDPECCFLWPC